VILIAVALVLKGSSTRDAKGPTLQGTLAWIVQLTGDTAAQISPGAEVVVDQELGVDPQAVADLGGDKFAEKSHNYQDCDGLRNLLSGNTGWRATYVARIPVPSRVSPEEMLRRTEGLWRDKGYRVARVSPYNPGRGRPVSAAVSLQPGADGPAISEFTLTFVAAAPGARTGVGSEHEGIIVASTPCLPLR